MGWINIRFLKHIFFLLDQHELAAAFLHDIHCLFVSQWLSHFSLRWGLGIRGRPWDIREKAWDIRDEAWDIKDKTRDIKDEAEDLLDASDGLSNEAEGWWYDNHPFWYRGFRYYSSLIFDGILSYMQRFDSSSQSCLLLPSQTGRTSNASLLSAEFTVK